MLFISQWKILKKTGRESSEVYKQLTKIYFEYDNKLADITDGNIKLNNQNEQLKQSTQNLAISMTELNQTLEIAKKAWGMVKQATQEAYKWMDIYNQDFNAKFTAGNAMHTLLGYSGSDIQSMFDYASELQSRGIVSDEAIIAGMQELSKHARGTTQQALKDLTKLTLDLAVSENGLNTSMGNVNSTASMLGRALEGQTETLRRTYGLTEAEVKSFKDLTDQGQKVNKFLEVMSKHVGNLNEELSDTAQGGLLQTRNEMNELYETLGEKVTPYIAAFEEAVYQLLKPALEWMANNMDWIAPTFLAVAAVIGVVIVAITALSIANFIAGASWLASLWPILLIIAAIGALIYLMAALINYIRSTRGEAQSALSAVLGYLGMFVSNFYNSFIVPIQHAIAMLVNFFANVWDHPLETILIHFANWTNTILGYINTIAQSLDVIFGTNFSDTISSWMKRVSSVKDAIIANSGYDEKMKLWDNLDTREMYNKGVALGDRIEAGIDKAFKGNEFFNKFNEVLIPGADGGIALNTTTGDSLLGEEDIQLLLDVATRDFKLDYQHITPEILITFGDVHETADVEAISEEIVNQLESVLDSDLMEVATA